MAAPVSFWKSSPWVLVLTTAALALVTLALHLASA